jgi:SulP family sulfate permease
MTAFRMNDWDSIKSYFSKRMKGPISSFLVTMLATIVFDLTIAILLGIGVALVVFLFSVSKLEVSTSKIERHKMKASDKEEHHATIEERFKDTVVVYISGPMFFMNSQKLTEALEKVVGYNTVILSIRGVPLVDVSAMTALSDYYEICEKNGIKLIVCGAHEKVMNKLKSYGLCDIIGNENFYFSVDRVLTCEELNI